MTHRRFNLVRDEDVTGLSGTGVVAEGVAFSDGVVSLRWTSAWPTSVVWHERGVASVEAIHGHNGKTHIEWLDREPTTRTLSRDDALDALEAMVWQHFIDGGKPGQFDHAFMSANEEAADVLVAARPDKWAHTPTGVRQKDDA